METSIVPKTCRMKEIVRVSLTNNFLTIKPLLAVVVVIVDEGRSRSNVFHAKLDDKHKLTLNNF